MIGRAVPHTDPTGARSIPPTERRMVRSPTSLLRLLVGAAVTVVGVLVTWRFSNTMAALNQDWEQLTHLLPAWIRAIPAVVVALTLLLVPVVVNVQLLRFRRFRLFGVVNLAAVTAFVASELLVAATTREAPSLFPRAYSTARGSVNDPLFAAFVAAFVVGIPYLPRSARRLANATVALSLVATLGFSDVPAVGWLVDLGLGITCGAGFALLFGTPDTAPDRGELVGGLARSGIEVDDIWPAAVDARGSTPWFGRTKAGAPIFVKVLGQDNRSADLMFRAFRAMFLRNSGDERPMSSLRRSVEHEALLSLRAAAVGISTPELLTVSEIGNDAMVLAFVAIDGDSLDRVPDDRITDEILDEVWRQVVVLQDNGIAHRDLRLANVFVGADDRVHLIDFGFAELAASPLLLATDLAELLGSTTTVVGVRRAVDAAHRAVGAEGLARAQGRLQLASLGGATRTALKESGAIDDLRREVATVARLPEPDYDGRMPSARWPALVWFALAVVVTGAIAWFASAEHGLAGIHQPDQLAWTVVAAVAATVASVGVAVGSMRDAPELRAVLRIRVASNGAELLGPLHTASVALRVRSLLARGVDTAGALGSVGIALATRATMHLAVLYLTVRLSGRDGSIDVADDADPAWSLAWIAVSVLLVAVVPLVAPLRRRVARDLAAPLRHAPAGFRAIAGHSTRLTQLLGGSLFVALATVGGLVAADRTVGGTLDPPSIALVALAVTLVTAVVAIPGGAGITEAGLIAGLVLLGERVGVAVSAVVVFRLVWTWIPAAIGCWVLGPLGSTAARVGHDPAFVDQSGATGSASGS